VGSALAGIHSSSVSGRAAAAVPFSTARSSLLSVSSVVLGVWLRIGTYVRTTPVPARVVFVTSS
jgi:hypothetical protein